MIEDNEVRRMLRAALAARSMLTGEAPPRSRVRSPGVMVAAPGDARWGASTEDGLRRWAAATAACAVTPMTVR